MSMVPQKSSIFLDNHTRISAIYLTVEITLIYCSKIILAKDIGLG